LVEWLRRRLNVRQTAVYSVPWSEVEELNPYHVKLNAAALDTPTFDWERWLRDHVIAHIPAAAKGGADSE
jgi:hypothetical protein